MAIQMSLANQFLIAMPSLNESVFTRAVIYVCEHHAQGTVGLIINRPMQYSLDLVLDKLGINAIRAETRHKPLLFGGPVQPERGFVVHPETKRWQSSLFLQEDVMITTSNDIIRAIADDRGPEKAMVILGYVAWELDQLEQEIKDNVWWVCPFSKEILYDVSFESRWEYAGAMLGINMNQLTNSVGHA